jgi:hypothetical protein
LKKAVIRQKDAVGSYFSVVGRDVDIFPSQLGCMNGDRLYCRHTERSARTNVEPCAVAGTLNLAADQFTIGKRTAVMRADVVDGVEGTVDVKHGNGSAVNLDQFFAPRGQLGACRDFDK